MSLFKGRNGNSVVDTPLWREVDVRTYGAKGDGTTDDTTSIMNAAEALRVSTTATPGTLLFPEGDYRVTGLDFSTHAGLKVVGMGSLATVSTGSPEHQGKTIIRALGSQSFVVKNASQQTLYKGITFHGNDQTTDAVLIVEYFTNQSKWEDCAFIHTKFDNSTPSNGAYLIWMGHNTNLEVDDCVFDNCFIYQNPANGSDHCYRGVFVNQSNVYRNHFNNCFFGGCYDAVYLLGGGINLFKCDFENHTNTHITRDFSNVSAGLAQMSPTWLSDCFTETPVPWVKDINATTPDPSQDQSFGELTLIDNNTSTYPNIDICVLTPVHIHGGKYGNISIQANHANGGAGDSFVTAFGVSFQGGSSFVGAGAATNLIEVATQTNTSGTHAIFHTFHGTWNLPDGITTEQDLSLNVPTGHLVLLKVNNSAKFDVSSTLATSFVDFLIAGNNFRWQENATPTFSQDTVSSDRSATDTLFSSQAPFASATGANRSPGNIVFTVPSAISGGTEGLYRINVGATSNALQISPTLATFNVALTTTGAFIAASASLTTDVAIGTTPATTGEIRLPDTGSIQFRNHANSGNISAVSKDTSDNIAVNAPTGASLKLEINGTAVETISGSLATFAQPIALGATPSTVGDLRFSNNFTLQCRNASNSGNTQVLTSDSSDNTIIEAGAASYILQYVGGNVMLCTSNRVFIYQTLFMVGSAVEFQENTVPAFTQDAPTTDRAATDWAFTSQAPYASASTNKNPGSFAFTIPAPIAGGTDGAFRINVGAITNALKVTTNGTFLANVTAPSTPSGGGTLFPVGGHAEWKDSDGNTSNFSDASAEIATTAVELRRLRYQAIKHTTGAQTLTIFTLTNANFSSYCDISIQAFFDGRDTGAGARFFGQRYATFHKEAGTMSQDGSTETIGTDTGSLVGSGASVSIAVSSTNIVVSVTTVGGQSVDWAVFMNVMINGIA